MMKRGVSYLRVRDFIRERLSVMKTELSFLGMRKVQVRTDVLDVLIERLELEGLVLVFRTNVGRVTYTEVVWKDSPVALLKSQKAIIEKKISEATE